MDGAPPRDRLAGFAFVRQNILEIPCSYSVHQERDVGEAQDRLLRVGLATETNDLGAPDLRPAIPGHRVADVLGGDQVEDDRQQSGVLDALVPCEGGSSTATAVQRTWPILKRLPGGWKRS